MIKVTVKFEKRFHGGAKPIWKPADYENKEKPIAFCYRIVTKKNAKRQRVEFSGEAIKCY